MTTVVDDKDKVIAWHFLPNDRRLRYGDRTLIEPGMTVSVNPQGGYANSIALCEWGLHASEYITHALNYAPGDILCRVEVGGQIVRGNDKLAGSTRKCLWMIDASRLLHEHALWCAELSLQCWRDSNPDGVIDPRTLNALHVKQMWLDGRATREELDAARAAAWDAARDAARAAAWDAARDAARAAARAAAGAAARDAIAQELLERVYDEAARQGITNLYKGD